MRLNIAIPEANVTKPVLDGALEAVTRLNEELIAKGVSPTSDELIEQGAKWQPEPPGQEHFDHGKLISERGWGDCDDWAPLHAATLRVTGEDPGAVAEVRKSGPKRWHATVFRSDGTEDDPSIRAGMPDPARRVGQRGAWVPQMFPHATGVNGAYIAKPQLALRPIVDRFGEPEAWQARADLPWHWAPPGHSPLDVAMVSLHQSPVSDQAITGAVRGAYRLGVAGGCADPDALTRLQAVADACEGASYEELHEMYGPEHAAAAGAVVGSFFGKALKGLGRIAKGAVKLAAPALSFIPGGSIATAAFNAASPAVKRSVMTRANVPPAQRVPQKVRIVDPSAATLPPRASRSAAPPPGFMPWPYPVPYPIPGWGGSSSAAPGVAWPPR